MAKTTTESPAQAGANPTPDKPGRDFKVVKGYVGPWPTGHVFPESEFRRVNPPPEKGPTGKPLTDAEADAYYESALRRLLSLEVITQVNHDHAPAYEAPMPTPPGPESEPAPKPDKTEKAEPAK